jgi:hypothetical protein
MEQGNYQGFPHQNARPNMRTGWCKIVIGASGATGGTGEDLAVGWTVKKNTTGVYDVTFPPAVAMIIVGVFVQYSATPTVGGILGSAAVDQTGGTWQFKTYANAIGTPVEPASGDVLILEFSAQYASVA